jgi:hypothetical protein
MKSPYDSDGAKLGERVSERNVAVTVELPTQMTPGNGHGGPTQFSVENRTIRFAPIAELRPGETQTFRVMGIARERGRRDGPGHGGQPNATIAGGGYDIDERVLTTIGWVAGA